MQSGPDLSQLWTVDDLGKFLRRSRRWVYYHLKLPPTDAGSIPQVRLGNRPLFVPGVIKEWTEAGFPPAETLDAWKKVSKKQRD